MLLLTVKQFQSFNTKQLFTFLELLWACKLICSQSVDSDFPQLEIGIFCLTIMCCLPQLLYYLLPRMNYLPLVENYVIQPIYCLIALTLLLFLSTNFCFPQLIIISFN